MKRSRPPMTSLRASALRGARFAIAALVAGAAPALRADDLRAVEQSLREQSLKPASPIRLVDPAVQRDGTAAAGLLHDRLEVVEAGSEDVGPLSTTLRDDPFDMRVPTGFSRVYRVPGRDDLLMRGNGALFVVFDESVYRRTRRGTMPVVGDGAVFHIGMPGGLRFAPELPDAERAANAASTSERNGRLDRRIDGRVRDLDLAEQATVAGMVDRESLRFHPRPAGSGVEQAPIRPESRSPRAAEAEPSSEPSPDASAAALDDAYAHLRLGPARVVR